ncbi:MAG: heme NO-binding domain-containing protein [Deferribacterota bacterium]|nr:heme NO-binding domain-containing protein [Deferribacterota bacterium]
MKALIINCIRDLVRDKFGANMYKDIAEKVGLEDKNYLNNVDIDDETFKKLIDELSKSSKLSVKQIFDAFGDYWVNVFSQKYFKSYYRTYKNAKDFLMAMDKIHLNVVNTYGGSTPPRFSFKENGNKLIIHYNSKRNLIDLLISLIKGVAKYYNQMINVNKIDNKTIEVEFK